MLYEFLKSNRNEVLALSEEKSRILAGELVRSELLKKGLPLFYEQLIDVLKTKPELQPQKEMLKSAAALGKEFLSLGYSLSHVVHAYGAMCQAITELAALKSARITSEEFNILNGCLDVAIAAAVSEYQYRSNAAREAREIKHIGFLAHELRNALSSATIAQEMIKAGLVGVGGSTASVLEASLVRMRHLIDCSLSEVRMRSDSDAYIEKFLLAELFDSILITAKIDAKKRNQNLVIETDWALKVETDRQYLFSAINNLIQNALKYSKTGANIIVRGRIQNERVVIEVQDECGGINPEKIGILFETFSQENVDRSGLGLGLSISQRAVDLIRGTIKVNNNPGFGCTFVIEIPQKLIPLPSNKQTVKGEDSVQPNFNKKN